MIVNPGLLRFAGKSGSSLVAPGVLRTLSFSRAQVASASTALTSDGVTRTEFAADIPRFNDIARRLLIEGQRTNSFRNPRCEGAVAGTPGTMPTFWSFAAALGLTTSVVGSGVEEGLGYVDVRFFGTPTSTGTLQVNHDAATTASDGQVWTYSLCSKLVGGSLTNVGQAAMVATAGTGNVITNYTIQSSRLGVNRTTCTVTAAGGATNVIGRLRFPVTVNLPVDATIRIGAVQLELGAFVSSPIFPSVGTPATSTRGADIVTSVLSRLNIGATGASTILMSVLLPLSAATTGALGLIAISDGTNSNRLYVRSGGGNTIVLNNTVGGVNATLVGTANTWTPGTVFRLGIVALGDGTVKVALNTGAIVSQAGGPTSGLTTLRIGSDPVGGLPMFGEINSLKILPHALSDTDLQNAVASIPV